MLLFFLRPHEIEPFQVNPDNVDAEDIPDLNREAKDHFVRALGGVCVVCGKCAGLETVKGAKWVPKARGNGYKKVDIEYERQILEMHHVHPVRDSQYRWRLAHLDFRSWKRSQWQEMMNKYAEEAGACELRCGQHHPRGRVKGT